MKTRRTVRRKQKGGFLSTDARVIEWRQKLRAIDSYHDFYNNQLFKDKRIANTIENQLSKFKSIEDLELDSPAINMSDLENSILNIILREEFEIIVFPGQFQKIDDIQYINKFKELYTKLFDKEYNKEEPLFFMADDGLHDVGKVMAQLLTYKENIGSLIYLISASNISDSSKRINPNGDYEFNYIDTIPDELPNEDVSLFGKIPIVYKDIKYELGHKFPIILKKTNFSFSMNIGEASCLFEYPVIKLENKETHISSGSSKAELAYEIAKRRSAIDIKIGRKVVDEFLCKLNEIGTFFDIKRAGDYHQVLTAVKQQKINNNLIFVTGDKLCALFSILHGLPTIFRSSKGLQIYRKTYLNTLIL